MVEPIRLRVWLLALAPVAAVTVLVVLVVRFARDDAKPRTPAAGAADTSPARDVPAPLASPRAQQQAPLPQLPPTPTPVTSAAPPAASASVVRPEHLPEIDDFFVRPAGSDEWSLDEAIAHHRERLDKLDARIRQLERELRAAERAGDTKAAEQKRVTLDYARSTMERIEARLRALGDASADAHSN